MSTATATLEPKAPSADEGTGKRAGGPLRCIIVTPEKVVLDEVVDFIALPLYDGELGVAPGRSPLVGRLGYGELRIRSATGTRRFFVDGGFAQVRDDVVTVLTNRAMPADRVDAVAAAEELERARSRRATTDLDIADKERTVTRARALLRVAGLKSVSP